jgi:hypothetical protein
VNERTARKSPRQLVEMMVQHNPDASDEQIAEVVSEWGALLEETTFQKADPVPAKDLRPGHRKPAK